MFSPGGGVAHDIEHQSITNRLAALESQGGTSDLWANRPTAPVTNQKFEATDRRIKYFWDGANWLSTFVVERQLSAKNFANPAPAPGVGGLLVQTMTVMSDYDLWVEKISANFVHFTAQSGVNFYTITSSLALTGGPWTTQADTVVGPDFLIEPTFAPAVWAKTNKVFQVVLQQSGAPGQVEFNATVRYRLVG